MTDSLTMSIHYINVKTHVKKSISRSKIIVLPNSKYVGAFAKLFPIKPYSLDCPFFTKITKLIVTLLVWCFRGGSRISVKGVHIYKGVGVRFVIFIHFFLNFL